MSTVNLDCKLDLKAITLQARNAEYNPKVWDVCGHGSLSLSLSLFWGGGGEGGLLTIVLGVPYLFILCSIQSTLEYICVLYESLV